MEKLANRISMKIASELSYSQDQQEVIEYGLIALIQTAVMVAAVLLLGLLLGIFTEAAAVCFGVSILRKYTGGAHASSILSCTIISAFLCLSFAFLGRFLAGSITADAVLIVIAASVYLYAVAIAIARVPVDSPNKPIVSEAKRHRLKARSLLLLAVYFLVSAGLFFSRDFLDHAAGILFCLLIAVAWQMGTLTGPGNFLVEGSDRLVYRIITLKGGHYNNEN